jgi:hypothetical protein
MNSVTPQVVKRRRRGKAKVLPRPEGVPAAPAVAPQDQGGNVGGPNAPVAGGAPAAESQDRRKKAPEAKAKPEAQAPKAKAKGKAKAKAKNARKGKSKPKKRDRSAESGGA